MMQRSPAMSSTAYRPTRLETACGVVYGVDASVEPLPAQSRFRTARGALEQAVLVGLMRPPCAVSFSGGRDSSAVLAVAAHVARREGLPLPVPVSLRFPDCEEADETIWQEQVIDHLGIEDWRRVELTDEMDVVGPYARRVLDRHGLLWPFNAYFHAPIAEEVPGGSVLTGFGGDELLLPPTYRRVAMILARGTTPRPRDVPRVVRAVAPRSVRRHLYERDHRKRPAMGWLQPQAQRDLARISAQDAARQPIRWDDWIRQYWWRCRYRRTACDSLDRVIAGAGGAVAVHPLCDPEFLVAIAAEHREVGFRNRTQAMEILFGDVLPASILSRSSKSHFNTAMWERYSREFDAHWDGADIDESIVDVAGLRAEWSSERPDARSFLLMQHAWLSAHERSAS